MELDKAILQIYPDVDFDPFTGNVLLDATGEGEQTIIIWNYPQPQPTQLELEAAYLAYLGDDEYRTKRAVAIANIKRQAAEQYDLWRGAYAGSGDWLAILQAVENALIATRQQAIADIRAAVDVAAIEAIMSALTWPPVPDQAEIEADVGDSLTAKAEAKQFLTDFPNARLLIELPYADLITAIQTRTAGQETLLLMTLAFAVRYLKQLIR